MLFCLILCVGCNKNTDSIEITKKENKQKYTLLEVLETNFDYNCLDNICTITSESIKTKEVVTIDINNNTIIMEKSFLVQSEKKFLEEILEYNYKNKIGNYHYYSINAENLIADSSSNKKINEYKTYYNNGEITCDKPLNYCYSYELKRTVIYIETLLNTYDIEV